MVRCLKSSFVVALLLSPLAARAADKGPELPKTLDLKALDAYAAAQVQKKGLVGLSLGIMKNGEIIFAKGYGKRSLNPSKPVEPSTAFAIGSVTKQFTCACIFLLAEEGKLSVKDPVAKYYPKLTRAKDITILDLMNHVSGYPDYYPLDFVDRRMMKPISFEQMAHDYAEGKLDFEPGSKYSYSNTGYILLGGIIEKVSKEPFAKFLEERILKPLKMENSSMGPSKGLPSVATGHTSFALGEPEPAMLESAGWIDAAGGLYCSPTDLLKWDLALMDGKVLKAESFKLMTLPRELSTGKISSYGCGLVKQIKDGETILQHSGAVSGFLAYESMIPSKRAAIVMLVNTEHISVRTSLYNDFLELLLKDLQSKDAPAIPKINGPKPEDAVLDFLHQMQSGKIKRENLGEEFSFYLNEERVKSGGARLKALGEPEKTEVQGTSERGGMEVASVKLTFKTAVLRGSLYRTPDGKIQQLLFYKE